MAGPEERVARALCRAEGNPENTQYKGRLMWESYKAEAEQVLKALDVETLTGALRGMAAERSVPLPVREKALLALQVYEGQR